MSIIRSDTTFDEIIFNNTNLEKVIRLEEIVFQKVTEDVIFDGNGLPDGITISGGSLVSGKYLYATVDDDGDDDSSSGTWFIIRGIDLTDYNYLYIYSDAYQNGSGIWSGNHYGTVYINWAIDHVSYNLGTMQRLYTLPSGSTASYRSFSGVLDISSYTGKHDLYFCLYACNDSTYSGYWSCIGLNISEIKLYN